MTKVDSYPLHGGQLHHIAKRFGIAAPLLLDFSANINPEGPPPAVITTLRACLDDLSTLTYYPDLQQTQLKRAIATYACVDPQNIIVANGFVPLIEATLRTLNIRSCNLPVPAFVEYRKTLERAGVAIEPHSLNAESFFNYNAAHILAAEHNAILLANPQNPSGVCHDIAHMRDIVGKASEKNTLVLLDEAFIDYLPHHSLTAATEEFSNLIVFRSVTKFYGIPGLRVAYAVTNPTLASSINENLPPWPITTLASRAVAAALADHLYADRARQENLHRRVILKKDLESLGLVVYPSDANFLLFALTKVVDPNRFWERMIVDHHIVLRNCAKYESLQPGHFRAAVKTQEDNSRLYEALKDILSR